MSSTETNVGKWDEWYMSLDPDEPGAYGNTPTWQLGVDWLASCSLLEDWGCGKGWLRTMVDPDRYRGLDGSRTPFADDVVDLADYRSDVPGVFIRHVLEHDYRWARILDNALASFTERLALVLFTPLVPETRDLEFEDPPGVPNLAFRLTDLTDRIDAAGVGWTVETLASPATKFGVEAIFRVQR